MGLFLFTNLEHTSLHYLGEAWNVKQLVTWHPQPGGSKKRMLLTSLSRLHPIQEASSWDKVIHIYRGSTYLT